MRRFLVEINEVRGLKSNVIYIREVEESNCNSDIVYRLFEEAQEEYDLYDSDEVIVSEIKAVEV